MTCERGCTGTPICSALDLCCIQFRQDCGKECDGLAVGFSTIQVDVDGNLVVCSNVGGVCECAPYVFCPPNAYFNRPPDGDDDSCDTSGEGTFCTDSVWVYDPTLPGADTATHGTCVRKWHRAGSDCNVNQWVEQIVPEDIIHVTGNWAQSGIQAFQDYTFAAQDTWIDIGDSVDGTLDNPSACYDMIVLAFASTQRINFFNNAATDPLLSAGVYHIVDGVPLGPDTLMTAESNAGNNQWHSITGGNYINAALVPPGGTVNYSLQPIIQEDSLYGAFDGHINVNGAQLVLLGIVLHPV